MRIRVGRAKSNAGVADLEEMEVLNKEISLRKEAKKGLLRALCGAFFTFWKKEVAFLISFDILYGVLTFSYTDTQPHPPRALPGRVLFCREGTLCGYFFPRGLTMHFMLSKLIGTYVLAFYFLSHFVDVCVIP